MSATDFRQLIDLHGGEFVGIECTDGVHIDVSFNGAVAKFDMYAAHRLIALLRDRMERHMVAGFDTFEFGIRNGYSVQVNYYDAGVILDALVKATRAAD